MPRLFISTAALESMSADGRVALHGEVLTLTALDHSFTITPAVRFVAVAGGDADPHRLVGSVYSEDQLTQMGADHMASSVIYADTAYDVQTGFVGQPMPPSW